MFNANMFDQAAFDEEVATLKESMSRVMWRAMNVFGFDNSKGTKIYEYQVEFCYMIDSVQRDSNFIATKQLSKIRELISTIRRDCNDATKGKDSDKEE